MLSLCWAVATPLLKGVYPVWSQLPEYIQLIGKKGIIIRTVIKHYKSIKHVGTTLGLGETTKSVHTRLYGVSQCQ